MIMKAETGFVSDRELSSFFYEQTQLYRDVLGEDFTPLHEKAVEALRMRMWQYHYEFPVRLILPVFDWKIRQLLGVKKKADMEEILKPSSSHYDITGWLPDTKYYFELEELLRLSVFGMRAPLASEYVDRLVELTGKYFPQETKKG